jgi:hypothetical protein
LIQEGSSKLASVPSGGGGGAGAASAGGATAAATEDAPAAEEKEEEKEESDEDVKSPQAFVLMTRWVSDCLIRLCVCVSSLSCSKSVSFVILDLVLRLDCPSSFPPRFRSVLWLTNLIFNLKDQVPTFMPVKSVEVTSFESMCSVRSGHHLLAFHADWVSICETCFDIKEVVGCHFCRLGF